MSSHIANAGLPVGSFRPARNRRSLGPIAKTIVNAFHWIYYNSWNRPDSASPDINNLHWFGYKAMKCPLDMWTYQELITEIRPDWIIETGTHAGGSAYFLASMLDLLGKGKIVTIDIEEMPNRPEHARLTYLTGSSTSDEILEQVSAMVGENDRCIVILDSDHSRDHVLKEMDKYEKFVQSGSYLIVEDTNINGHPVKPRWGRGPYEAVQEFLTRNRDFVVDKGCERFLMTLNPGGYLRRV